MKYHSYESRSGSHWRHFANTPAGHRHRWATLLIPLYILTLPCTILTIFMVIMAMPLLRLRDRRRHK